MRNTRAGLRLGLAALRAIIVTVVAQLKVVAELVPLLMIGIGIHALMPVHSWDDIDDVLPGAGWVLFVGGLALSPFTFGAAPMQYVALPLVGIAAAGTFIVWRKFHHRRKARPSPLMRGKR